MKIGLTHFKKLLTDKGASGHFLLNNLFLCIQQRLVSMQKVDLTHHIDSNGRHHGRCVNYGHITPITEAIYTLQYFTHIEQRIDDIILSVSKLENIEYGIIPSFDDIKGLYHLDTLPGWEIYDRVNFKHSDPARCIYRDNQMGYDPSTFCAGCGLPRARCTCVCEKCNNTFNECKCNDIDDTSIVPEKCKECSECGELDCICSSIICATCKKPIDTSFLHIGGYDRGMHYFHPQCSVPVCEICRKYIPGVTDPSSIITINGIRYHRRCYYANANANANYEQKTASELCMVCNQPCITIYSDDDDNTDTDINVHTSCLTISAVKKDENTVDYNEAMNILIDYDLVDNTSSSSSSSSSSFGKRSLKKSVGKRKTKKSIGKRKTKKSVGKRKTKKSIGKRKT